MGLNVEDVIAELDPAERRQVEEMAAAFIAEEMTLRPRRRQSAFRTMSSREPSGPLARSVCHEASSMRPRYGNSSSGTGPPT